MLYNDDAVMAIIAGMAYCINNFPTFSVPNAIGDPFCSIRIFLINNSGAKVLNKPWLCSHAGEQIYDNITYAPLDAGHHSPVTGTV